MSCIPQSKEHHASKPTIHSRGLPNLQIEAKVFIPKLLETVREATIANIIWNNVRDISAFMCIYIYIWLRILSYMYSVCYLNTCVAPFCILGSFWGQRVWELVLWSHSPSLTCFFHHWLKVIVYILTGDVFLFGGGHLKKSHENDVKSINSMGLDGVHLRKFLTVRYGTRSKASRRSKLSGCRGAANLVLVASKHPGCTRLVVYQLVNILLDNNG